MNQLLPSPPLLIAFLAASLLLAITPGPGVAYIVTRSLSQGPRAGLASVAGVALGNFGNALAAAVGLAAWFAVSATAFLVVKYAGAGYLIYLGLRTLLSKSCVSDCPKMLHVAVSRIFRDGLVVALLNPKTTIFFAAFLPQFMGDGPAVARGIVLGTMFVAIAGVTDSLYALAAGSMGASLSRSNSIRAIGRYVSGVIYLLLGVFSAAPFGRVGTAPKTH